MAKTETVSGNGNTAQPGFVTIAAGVTYFVDEVAIANTIRGSGQTNIEAVLGTSTTAPPIVYNTGGGSGTVSAAGGGDYVALSGTKWVFNGNVPGNDTVISSAGLATIGVGGNGTYPGGQSQVPSNVVELAGAQAVVNSFGTNDLIEDFAGLATINALNTASIEMDGGAATVHVHGVGSVKAFFTGQGGGRLDFINNSTVAATVSGNVPGGTGGSVTAFGGYGGGVYVGGAGGNNSLIGGAAAVTLVAGNGNNNILEAAGFGNSYAAQNEFVAGSGTSTLTADSTTGYNEFIGETGNLVMTSFGKGNQTYYVGAQGLETITGSRAAGATNEYIFDQDRTGSGMDSITNFRLGTDHIDINFNGTLSGVTIKAIDAVAPSASDTAGGSLVTLSDQTQITLYGVSRNSLSLSIIGGTHI
jgi:hypothetical protein